MEETGRFAASNGGGAARTRRRSKASKWLPLVTGCVEIRKDSSPFGSSDPAKAGRWNHREATIAVMRHGCRRGSSRGVNSVARKAADGTRCDQQWSSIEAPTLETRRTLTVGCRMQQACEPYAEQAARVVRNHRRRRPSRRIARWAEGRETGRERDACGDVDGGSTSRIPREADRMRLAASGPRETGARKGNLAVQARAIGQPTARRPAGRFEGQPGDGPTATEARGERLCSPRW